jgi:hypothetical protein
MRQEDEAKSGAIANETYCSRSIINNPTPTNVLIETGFI